MKHRRDNAGIYLLAASAIVLLVVAIGGGAWLASQPQIPSVARRSAPPAAYAKWDSYEKIRIGMLRSELLRLMGDQFATQFQSEAGDGGILSMQVESLGWQTGRNEGIVVVLGNNGAVVSKMRCKRGDKSFFWD